MSKLLLDEDPLLILPQLAVDIGLNESIVIQQVHYWININIKAKKNFYDGFYWTYNTYEQWQEQMPFWSECTIKRIILALEKRKLLIVGRYNKLKIDRTKWYRIDYKLLESIASSPLYQSDTLEEGETTSPLPETITKTRGNNIAKIDSVGLCQVGKRFYKDGKRISRLQYQAECVAMVPSEMWR